MVTGRAEPWAKRIRLGQAEVLLVEQRKRTRSSERVEHAMSRQIQYILEWTITRGQQGAFKRLALAAIEAAKADEPGTLGYQWYFNKDESKCYVAESYADAGSMVTHLENIAPVLSEFFKLSAITRFEVFGDLTREAEKALTPLRAQTFDHWSGFTR